MIFRVLLVSFGLFGPGAARAPFFWPKVFNLGIDVRISNYLIN